jgi:hypothetical protein
MWVRPATTLDHGAGDCDVVAPALIPRNDGAAAHPGEEAFRDLARARDDAREGLQRCHHRLGKLLLRRGLHFSCSEICSHYTDESIRRASRP